MRLTRRGFLSTASHAYDPCSNVHHLLSTNPCASENEQQYVFLTGGPHIFLLFFPLGVPVELFAEILQLFHDCIDPNGRNISLVNRETRQIFPQSGEVSLQEEADIRKFCADAAKFHDTFRTTLPTITFCNLRSLLIVFPPTDSDMVDLLNLLFSSLSPTLRKLTLQFDGYSATGREFMLILQNWAPSLQTLRVLKLKYNYYMEDEEVSSAFSLPQEMKLTLGLTG